MKKISQIKFNPDVVKEKPEGWWDKNIELWIEKKVISKPTKAESEKAYKDVTGKSLIKN